MAFGRLRDVSCYLHCNQVESIVKIGWIN